ncbi:MAG: DUF222 domain-containing protein [Ilumatobacteraceae bacterium]
MSVVGSVEALVEVDWSACDQDVVTSALGDVRRVRGWLDSIEIAAARRLSELAVESPAMFPERLAADAARVGVPEASKAFERAATTTAIPELDAVLISGDTSAGHVDVVTRALRQLTPDQRDRLAERGEVLALAAAELPRDEFARTVRAEVRRIHDDDGIDRLQQQRRNTSLRTWTDRDTGMWCLRGEFDPETGALLAGRLRNTVEAMFHDHAPDTCPTDPLAKHHHLQALALDALTHGRGAASSGRIDMSVLIDINTLIDGEQPDTIIDCGIPIDLPAETLRRWACQADITPIIVAADGVSLYLGRTQRVANRAQRRALRAVYRHCAIPDCTVTYEHCQIHHVHWYRNGGNTDIDNLARICNKHHHLVHEGGWQLSIDNHRNLTITYPDRTTMTTGPPTAGAR